MTRNCGWTNLYGFSTAPAAVDLVRAAKAIRRLSAIDHTENVPGLTRSQHRADVEGRECDAGQALGQALDLRPTYARKIQRAVVLLPHPDSPTSASVSPLLTSKDTSSTARTWPTTVRRKPRRMGKNLRRCFTSRSESLDILLVVPLAAVASTGDRRVLHRVRGLRQATAVRPD